jgi:hypothetical protein
MHMRLVPHGLVNMCSVRLARLSDACMLDKPTARILWHTVAPVSNVSEQFRYIAPLRQIVINGN